MTSKIIKDRAEKFVLSLTNLSVSEIKAQCKAEIKELKEMLSIASVRSALTFYRKESENKGFNITAYLSISKAENNTIEKAYTKTIVKQHKNLVEISDFRGLIEAAKEVLLSSENVVDLAAALCVLTGRRATEILKTAKFLNNGKSKNTVIFEGQLKKGSDSNRYVIYLLDNCKDLVKDALKRVRQLADTKELDNEAVNRRYEKSINSKAVRLFSSFLGRCTSHDLRKAYAAIATNLYKPENETINSFLANILGHSADDLTTANSYQKYFIKKV